MGGRSGEIARPRRGWHERPPRNQVLSGRRPRNHLSPACVYYIVGITPYMRAEILPWLAIRDKDERSASASARDATKFQAEKN